MHPPHRPVRASSADLPPVAATGDRPALRLGFPGSQRGFAALMLTMLVLMLVLVPAMWLYQSAADRQRVLDAQVRSMLKGTPRPPAAAPAPTAQADPASGAGAGEAPAQSR
jgi:hypothetical protein